MPLAGPFAWLVESASVALGLTNPSRLLTNAHLAFNVLLTLGFLPLLTWVQRLIAWAVPVRGPAVEGILEHVGPEHAAGPAETLQHLHQSVLRLGRYVRRLVADVYTAVAHADTNLLDEVVEGDDRIDLGADLVADYLVKLPEQQLNAEEAALRRRLFFTVRDLEAIGDVVSKELVGLGRKHVLAGEPFSLQDQTDLERLHGSVLRSMDAALAFFESGDPGQAKAVLARETAMGDRQQGLYAAHLRRMERGVVEAIRTSAVYLDMVRALREIHGHVADIVRVLQDKQEG